MLHHAKLSSVIDTEPKRLPESFSLSQPLSTARALDLWRNVHMEHVTSGLADLSMRQITILLTVYMEPPPHTVRGLAALLNVTKPVITRALDSMGKLELVNRKRDPKDMRNVLIMRTVKGALFLENLADLISKKSGEL